MGSAPAFALQRRLAPTAYNGLGEHIDLLTLAQQPVEAVAAIARPAAFFAMLQAQGIPLAATQSLPDHADFAHFSRQCGHDTPLLCTEKDAHKLWCQHPQAWAVPLQLQLPADFWDLLARELAKLQPTNIPPEHVNATTIGPF